jgi:glycosyltransferase involved in cell wall biosynthesis
MEPLAATVLIPTSGDRAELVRLALACTLKQTIQNIEVFIIGDGVAGPSRETLRGFAREDSRVRFFDHPKHTTRGEPYRHAALKEARGRIVAYCCDRDLWLSHHLETLDNALREVDFTNTLEFIIQTDGTIMTPRQLDLSKERHRFAMHSRMRHFDPLIAPGLSCTGHTLDAYRRLPEGWTQTPTSHISDCYMWQKFARNPDITAKTVARATLLYFHRERFPGWPAEKRLAELKPWADRVLNDPTLYPEVLEAALGWIYFQRSNLLEKWQLRMENSIYHYKGKTIQFFQRIRQIGIAAELRRRRGKS